MRLAVFLLLVACGGGSGDSDSSSTPTGGTTTDPACTAVWDKPFRTPNAVTCYGTTGTTPSCYGCVLIRSDRFIVSESDVVSIAEDPVSCSGGAFSQGGAIATYDAASGELTVPDSYAGVFIEDDLGVCDGLLQL